MSELAAAIKSTIRDVPDFPKPGIIFKDITPVLARHDLMKGITARFAGGCRDKKIDAIVGMESRGFLFGVPLAMHLGIPFVPARKPGKLPYHKVSESYALEYGSATLELHTDALARGQRALIVDDLIATGGTALATAKLVERLGAEVAGFGFVIELAFLGGRKVLGNYPVDSIVAY
ncbi:MAG: adenine phosphoribosyltransferase [Deltaproteobacteria bacterium]|nr:adenine phosphoribosyltransferase [Deltaproteobacteria bacterium]